MAEERFYYAHGVVWDTKKSNGLNGISINDLDNGLRVANWLNELNDENEKLKSENEELKIDISVLYRHYDKYEEICTKLKRENEELKSELAKIKRQEQEVIEYLQTYHNGDVNELKKELKE